MKYLRLYLKIFLWTALPIVALGMLASIGFYILLQWIPSEKMGGTLDITQLVGWFTVGLVPGIIFGEIMSISLSTLHILRIRNLPTQEPENITPNQSRTLILETDRHRAFSLCNSSLMLINAKLKQANESAGHIVAKKPTGFWSWGEIIEIKVSSMDSSKSQITVTSRPSLKTTLVDFGQNTENVEKICWYLKDKLNT